MEFEVRGRSVNHGGRPLVRNAWLTLPWRIKG